MEERGVGGGVKRHSKSFHSKQWIKSEDCLHPSVTAACGTIALIIFGAMGDGRNFMPDWEHNYLSWSFGLAFVGVVMM